MCMKFLGNLNCRLLPDQKCLLYKIYVLLITFYGFLLWYYNKVPLSHPLNKMQQWTATWILSMFCISPTFGIEAIISLISIHVICKPTHPRNYIPAVISSPNYTSLPSTVATFLATCLMAVLQPSGYSVFHGRDTPIQLGLPWRSYPYQCLNTETSAWSNRGFETLSISYTICLYIRLVVIL